MNNHSQDAEEEQPSTMLAPPGEGHLLSGHRNKPPYTDRDLAIAVRAALLAIIDAIERRWDLKPKKPN